MRSLPRLAPRLAALLFFISAYLFVISAEPIDHGYSRYGAMAETMARTGDWVLPDRGDRIYLDKPPLFLWIIALPIAATGRVIGLWSHFPNLLASVLSLFVAYRLGRAAFRKRGAAIAVCGVLATFYGFFDYARGERIDPLFAALLGAALVFAFLALSAPRSTRLTLPTLAAIALAAATLAKGPLAVALFLLVVVPFAFWQAAGRRLVSRGALIGTLIFLVLLLPWPWLVLRRLGIDRVLEILSVTQFATRSEPWYHYLKLVPLFLLPWTILIPSAAIGLMRVRNLSPSLRFAFCWTIGMLVPLQLSGFKHVRYLLPIAPAVALLLVAGLRHAAASGPLPARLLRPRPELLGRMIFCLLLLGAVYDLGIGARYLNLDHRRDAEAAIGATAGAVGTVAFDLGIESLWVLRQWLHRDIHDVQEIEQLDELVRLVAGRGERLCVLTDERGLARIVRSPRLSTEPPHRLQVRKRGVLFALAVSAKGEQGR